MKDILVNVLFILVLLFLTQSVMDWQRKKLNRKSKQWIIYISSMIGILFCMTNSISFSEQYIFDLRSIPQIIGSLYGGPVVSIGLYITMIIYRAFIGIDLGLYGAMINNGSLAIVLCLLSKRFLAADFKRKLLISFIIIALQMTFTYIVFKYIIPSGMPELLFWQTGPIKVVTISFIVLTLEAFRRYYRLRDQIHGYEKMEMVHHLSASISHEVRNGLTSTKGFLQLLREGETDSQKQQYIRIALDELDRTENIVRDFLTFAKPSPTFIKGVEMDRLIQHTLVLIEPLAKMHSIEIRKEINRSIVMGDESLIQQTLLNILKNAIEAMPNGGVLEVCMISNDLDVIITIKDTGVGMSAIQIERLGTPYYSTKGQKGTGLGMMVAFRVIKELNGKINVASEVGKGTTLTITLPKKLPIPYMDSRFEEIG